MVTLKMIAERAQVSLSVVSAVVNGSHYVRVSEATRERIEAIVAETGYRPNAAARSLRTAKSNVMAVLLPRIDNPVFLPLKRGAYEAARRIGYAVWFGDADLLANDVPLMRNAMVPGAVDGLLLRSASLVRHPSTVAEISHGGVPVLLLDDSLADNGMPWLSINDAAGIRLGVEALIGAGHRRIGWVGGQEFPLIGGSSRVSRFQHIAGELGVAVALAVPAGYRPEDGYAGAVNLLQVENPPTALLVNNVTTARGVIAAAVDLGIRIPSDLSVLAYQDSDDAAFFRPRISTVRLPMFELGRRAVEVMSAVVAGESVLGGYVDEPAPEIVDRGSIGSPRVQK